MSTTYGEQVKAKRKELGWSQSKLAQRVGSHAQTIDKIERGTIKFSRYLPRISVALGLAEVNGDAGPADATVALIGRNDLPLFFSAVEDGVMTINPASLSISRPQPLAGVTDAYAVVVSSGEMEPAFEVGDRVLINPLLPPEEGKDVMLRNDNRALIARLDKVSKDTWTVHQHSNGKRFKVSRKQFPDCHRVVGKFSR